MRHTRCLRTAVSITATTVIATTVAFVAGVAAAAPASAGYLCYGAGVSGTITGDRDVPTTCVWTVLPTLCAAPEAGLEPTIGVHAVACIPG